MNRAKKNDKPFKIANISFTRKGKFFRGTITAKKKAYTVLVPYQDFVNVLGAEGAARAGEMLAVTVSGTFKDTGKRGKNGEVYLNLLAVDRLMAVCKPAPEEIAEPIRKAVGETVKEAVKEVFEETLKNLKDELSRELSKELGKKLSKELDKKIDDKIGSKVSEIKKDIDATVQKSEQVLQNVAVLTKEVVNFFAEVNKWGQEIIQVLKSVPQNELQTALPFEFEETEELTEEESAKEAEEALTEEEPEEKPAEEEPIKEESTEREPEEKPVREELTEEEPTEEPAKEELTEDEPTEEKTEEEPVVEEPAEEPIEEPIEEPAIEEPVIEEPAIEEPVTELADEVAGDENEANEAEVEDEELMEDLSVAVAVADEDVIVPDESEGESESEEIGEKIETEATEATTEATTADIHISGSRKKKLVKMEIDGSVNDSADERTAGASAGDGYYEIKFSTIKKNKVEPVDMTEFFLSPFFSQSSKR